MKAFGCYKKSLFLHMDQKQTHSLEAILEKYVPPEELPEVQRILFGWNQGNLVQKVPLDANAEKIASENGFDFKAFKFGAASECTRKPRVVKIGLIQHSVDVDTSAPVPEQVELISLWSYF